MSPTRKIIHIDMDAFYASVEQRDNPAWRGQPLVVAWQGNRSVVCAASYEARRFGVHSAMPASRAARLCPQAIWAPPDFERYRAVSRQVRDIFSRYTDLIEPLSLDEAYLDVTADTAGLGSATATAEAIRSAIRQELSLTASAGIASNKFLAKIASDWNKPDGLFVVRPHDMAAFLQQLPVGKVPGVGRVTRERLAEMAIHTVGDLRDWTVDQLVQVFGRYGARLRELADGIDERPVQARLIAKQVSAETTFADDILLADMQAPIERLCVKVWDQCGARHRGLGRTAVLKLKTTSFRQITRSQTWDAPPATLAQWQAAAVALCRRVELPELTRYRLVGIGVHHFADKDETTLAARQTALF